MFKIKFYYYIILLLLVTIITCKNNEPMITDYTGMEIKEIKADTIFLENGTTIHLPEESISKVFYLVRHAEKDTTIQGDPPLTDIGLERATKLADILKGTRVDQIYSTLTLRTMYTADSLADIKAMKLLPYNNKTLKDVISKIKSDDDANRIFMVGHNNTVPAIANTLVGKDVFTQTFGEDDYGNFVIVVLYNSGETEVYKLRY